MLMRNLGIVCMRLHKNDVCVIIYNHESITSSPIFATAIFLATRGSYERKKHRLSFRYVFWRVSLARLVEGDGGRRNASGILICAFCTLISIVGFSLVSRRSSTNERRFQITFCTKPRPAVYLPRFFVNRSSFHIKKKRI